MKVYKGIFEDRSYPDSDMNNKECVAVEIGNTYLHVTKAEGGEYSRNHQGTPYCLPMLKDGYAELDCITKEELLVEEKKETSNLKGLKEFFGQELSKLTVEFKA